MYLSNHQHTTGIVTYGDVKLLWCTAGTTVTLCVNYTQIKKLTTTKESLAHFREWKEMLLNVMPGQYV